MSDGIIILLAIVLIGPCAVYTIWRIIKDKNVNTVDEEVKKKLSDCEKTPVRLKRKGLHILNENAEIYEIDCYIRSVYAHHGTRVVFIYYDYIQKRFISRVVNLNMIEVKNNVIEKGGFVKILVYEKTNRLQYISVKC